jgi:polysaccharide biosynthesis transport protein
MDDAFHQSPTLRDHVHTLTRRKWTLLAAVVLTPLAAVAFSLLQEPRYQATAEVLLTQANVPALLDRDINPSSEDANRLALTQARLARVPVVVERTLRRARVPLTIREFLEASDVAAVRDTDILDFRVSDRRSARAAALASEYAKQFTVYRRELDTLSVRRARAEVKARIAQLERTGERQTRLYATLLDKDQQLATIETLETSNAFVVKRAQSARQVQPRPVRNAMLGLGLGLFLGILLALLRDALDTRVRTAEEVGGTLELPLLARLAAPPKRLRSNERLIMVQQPDSTVAEGFRMLRANLEFAMLGRDVTTVVVTSAVEGEGKSTTCANLAVAFARIGRRVVLVDLDLRRPFVHRFFRLPPDQPGLTNVALGHVTLEQAICRVAISSAAGTGVVDGNGRREDEMGGLLDVLLTGPLPPAVGEFVASDVLGEILSALRDRADLVLIDVPPLLRVGDVMSLSSKVDAALIVARPKLLRKRTLAELHRVSRTIGIPLLGYVITDADSGDQYGYGYGYGYGRTGAGAGRTAARGAAADPTR